MLIKLPTNARLYQRPLFISFCTFGSDLMLFVMYSGFPPSSTGQLE